MYVCACVYAGSKWSGWRNLSRREWELLRWRGVSLDDGVLGMLDGG